MLRDRENNWLIFLVVKCGQIKDNWALHMLYPTEDAVRSARGRHEARRNRLLPLSHIRREVWGHPVRQIRGGGAEGAASPRRRRRRRQEAAPAPHLTSQDASDSKQGRRQGCGSERQGGARRKQGQRAPGRGAPAAPASGAAAGGVYAEYLPRENRASALAGGAQREGKVVAGQRGQGSEGWAWPPARRRTRSLEISTEARSSWAAEALAASLRRRAGGPRDSDSPRITPGASGGKRRQGSGGKWWWGEGTTGSRGMEEWG